MDVLLRLRLLGRACAGCRPESSTTMRARTPTQSDQERTFHRNDIAVLDLSDRGLDVWLAREDITIYRLSGRVIRYDCAEIAAACGGELATRAFVFSYEPGRLAAGNRFSAFTQPGRQGRPCAISRYQITKVAGFPGIMNRDERSVI